MLKRYIIRILKKIIDMRPYNQIFEKYDQLTSEFKKLNAKLIKTDKERLFLEFLKNDINLIEWVLGMPQSF